MKTINKTKFAIGASIIAGLTTGCASDSNPFAQEELSSGYMNQAESDAQKAKEAACGEGKCGGDMAAPAETPKAVEAKCGEGKCGEKMAAPVETPKAAEGKCGEGKCGADK
ncbi:MAG: hypothetical protein GQ583_10960 [Methyloprofundus sp.]|nr:hypothetical protein [Methyloprofundus sp.]